MTKPARGYRLGQSEENNRHGEKKSNEGADLGRVRVKASLQGRGMAGLLGGEVACPTRQEGTGASGGNVGMGFTMG